MIEDFTNTDHVRLKMAIPGCPPLADEYMQYFTDTMLLPGGPWLEFLDTPTYAHVASTGKYALTAMRSIAVSAAVAAALVW